VIRNSRTVGLAMYKTFFFADLRASRKGPARLSDETHCAEVPGWDHGIISRVQKQHKWKGLQPLRGPLPPRAPCDYFPVRCGV